MICEVIASVFACAMVEAVVLTPIVYKYQAARKGSLYGFCMMEATEGKLEN